MPLDKHGSPWDHIDPSFLRRQWNEPAIEFLRQLVQVAGTTDPAVLQKAVDALVDGMFKAEK